MQQSFKQFAINTAKAAGNILMLHYQQIQEMEYKLKTNFKTKVDDLSDAFIRTEIQKHFPEHNIYSEEQENLEQQSDYTWVVDPLDGTLPYTYGISDHFAVSIGLAYKKRFILGVIYAPLRKELYVAEEGKGAFLNNKKITISTLSDINKAMLGIDYGKGCGKNERLEILQLQRKLLADDGICYPVTYACSSVALALVAAGKLHGYISLNLEPWDIAAAVVIVREAGGKVTDKNGKDCVLGDTSIIAANKELHGKLIQML
ncbi:inositol monophosphatase [Candidatus Woesearchaeota archaeon]|nr:inositol monophosphatase [Candidatus Woesearchaeota archaeon]